MTVEATLKSGIDVSIFYFDKAHPFKHKGVKFFPIPGNITADPTKAKRLSFIGAIKDIGYYSATVLTSSFGLSKKTVLYAHTPIGGLIGLTLKAITRVPLVYDPHDWFYEIWVNYHRNISGLKKSTASCFLRILNVLLQKIADVFICVSEEMMNAVKTSHKKFLIPNYVDEIKENNKAIRINDNKKTILFVGHVAIYQGVLNLLKAFNLSNKTLSDYQLIIVGDGEDLNIAKEFIEKNKLKTVKLTGSVSREIVHAYIKQASLCVAPFLSLPFVKTSNPFKILEYAALGKKIVVTDIPTFRKMLAGYDNAFFSAPNPKSLAKAMITALQQEDRPNQKISGIFSQKDFQGKINQLYDYIFNINCS